MKKTIASFALMLVFASLLASCSRSVSVQQAANNHYRHCRPVK